jgi:glycosyltransferase involved in cell wall biosynthesis
MQTESTGGTSQIRSVLFLTYHFPPEIGGIQTRIAHYLDCLHERRIRTTVFFAVSHPNHVGKSTQYGATVIVRLGNTRYLLQNMTRLSRLMASQRVDAVHVFTGVSTILSVFTLAAGRLKRVPTVISIFGREEFDLSSLRQRLLFNTSARLASSIAVNSSFTRGLLPATFREKTHVILGGADPAGSSPPHAVPKAGGPAILFVGRLVKSKGVDDLLLAYKAIKRAIPDARLVIVGDGPERDNLVRMSRELGLDPEDVRFKGTLRGQALDQEYDNSSVVVLPSKRVQDDPATETFGLSLVEALMHSKPIVGSRLGGIPEIVEPGVNGFLVHESRPDELAEILRRLLSDENLSRTLGRNALDTAQRKFSWSAATDRLLSCYLR